MRSYSISMVFNLIIFSLLSWFPSSGAQEFESVQIDKINLYPPFLSVLIKNSDFKETFFDSSNIREYVDRIDELINFAINNITADKNETELLISLRRKNQVMTDNQILMVYTINKIDTLYLHYFSVSRREYFMAPFALYIIALFCERTGFNIPPTIWVSLTPVYHGRWLLTKAQHDSFLIRVKNRNAPWEESARRALQKRYLTKIEVFDPLYNCSW